MKNLINSTDSYKLSQYKQYPQGTTHISSYIESRGGEPSTVFFGLQAYIKDYLLHPVTVEDKVRAKARITAHGYEFNEAGWDIIINEYGGYAPLTIQAVPEGTVMPPHNVQVQVTNNDARLAWLTSYIETSLLRAIWYPSTVATKSRKLKKLISSALHRTSDIPVADQINFKLHDFGARGASSGESAILGGMAHLVNFMGSDTYEAVDAVMDYYNTDMAGFSIPASEHSTITSWGKLNETAAYENMINQFAGDGKIYACVSDSYDLWYAIDHIWGTALKDKIISSGGTLVVRPDSGEPTTVPVDAINKLMSKFGYSTNSKGFKVLPPYIRLIQGDGLNETTLTQLLSNLEYAKISIDNIAFGMGGGLLQAWNRDTLGYAMKASAIRINNGPWTGFSKDPTTDHGKKSKEGRLGLAHVCGVGSCGYRTEPEHLVRNNLLRTVYSDGKLLVEDNFSAIRERAILKVEDYEQRTIERY